MSPLHVEASMTGDPAAVFHAVLFGLLSGLLYTVFCIFYQVVLALPYGGSPFARRFLSVRKKSLRGKATKEPQAANEGQIPLLRKDAHGILLFVLDFLFCIICAVLFCIFLYDKNNGVFRWYLPLSAGLGFFLWQNTCGILLMRLSDNVRAVLHLLSVFFWNILLYPLHWFFYTVFRRIHRGLCFIVSGITHRIRAKAEAKRIKRKKKQSDLLCLSVEAAALHGFLHTDT